MRALMLSWEYPPLVVGGLGRHVEALAGELAAAGHEIHVVTRGDRAAGSDEIVGGVHVHRAAADPLAIDFTTESLLGWAQASEHALVRAALPVLADLRPDVVHAHDWLVAQSAITSSRVAGAPLVATVHATEAGRHQGWLPDPLNRAIHSVERWLVRSADAVITCSGAMRDETARLFDLAPPGVDVVPNGIDVARWRVPAAEGRAMRERVGGEGGALVVFAGRLVHEKGVQTVLDALRPLRQRHPGARLVVAGTGPYADTLRARARRLGVARGVSWLGHVTDRELAALLAAADVGVVPSLYEPFGLVALEFAAARTPLVVADTGGLAELAAHGVAAQSYPAGDAAGLVTALDAVLADPAAAGRAVARASRAVRRRYGWAAVALRTAAVYERVARPAPAEGTAPQPVPSRRRSTVA